MKIRGYNDFYDGWLCNVLLQPRDTNKSDAWLDGWDRANRPNSVLALQAEIHAEHILVEP